jgi:hypothetical protein
VKKVLLVIMVLALMLSLTGCLRTEGESIAVAAEDFVNLLSQGEYVQAARYFDETMKTELSPVDLEAAWKTLLDKGGEFLKQEYIEVHDFDFHRVIRVAGIFEKARVEFRVTFNEAEEIAGLYIK